MRIFPRKIIGFLLLAAVIFSCGSGTEQLPDSTANDTIARLTSPSPLKPFEPDDNYVAPAEVVSQYGPGGIIRDVEIDDNGIIWMAAWDGIVSYDGKEFTNHTLKSGLSHHRVYSLMKDSKGNMWFGTMGAGAYKYDGTKFTNYSTNNGMIDNVVYDLFEDTGGNIWFATDSGVSRFSELSGANIFMSLTEKDSLIGNVQAISQDKNGTIWFGTSFGLYTYTAVAKIHGALGMVLNEVLSQAGTHYSNVRDLYQDNLGNVLMGTARGLYHINTVPGSKNKITRINEEFTGYVCEDNSAQMLITSDGLSRFDGRNYETIVEGASNLGIFGACEAKDGTIWYGAMDGLHSVRDGKDVSYKKP